MLIPMSTGVVRAGSLFPFTYAVVPQGNSNSISTIDISDPTNLAVLDTLSDATNLDNAQTVAMDLANQTAYVTAEDTTRLTAIDVSNPSSVSVSDSIVTQAQPTFSQMAIDTSTSRLYLPTGFKMEVYNISNPASLSFVSEYTTDAGAGNQGVAVDAANNVLLSARGTLRDGFQTIDVSNPAALSQLDLLNSTSYQDCNSCVHIPGTSNFLVGSEGSNIVVSVSVSGAGAISVLDTVAVSGPRSVVYDSVTQTAYTTSNGDLVSIDASNLSSLSIIDTLPTTMSTNTRLALDAVTKYVYAAEAGSTFRSFDVSNPSSLSETDSIAVTFASDVALGR